MVDIPFNISLNRLDESTDPSDGVYIIDFLNLLRNLICDTADAKFKTINELINGIKSIALYINKIIQDFEEMYIVTKFFKPDNEILYDDIPKIIMWSFGEVMMNKINKIKLVLVNGTDIKDKEADDRALFILYNEISLTKPNICILSNDRFDSIENHFSKKVTLKFYHLTVLNDSWKTSEILSSYKGVFYHRNQDSRYNIYHPKTMNRQIVNIN